MNIKFMSLITMIFLYSCTQSGRRKSDNSTTRNQKVDDRKYKGNNKKVVVKMTKINGVYQVPVEINGSNMFFIFDTGAGMVSISGTEALFLYKQGSLTDDDITGTANFTDANGDISEGTIINLKTVKVGDRVLNNIQASVVHNMEAPLLLGQSVLERFGKISIDNKSGELVFE
jgi:aspartyl protease family protein